MERLLFSSWHKNIGKLSFAKETNMLEDKKATEYLANERTFLAWIRMSIAIISLGFVIAKFDVWLRELAMRPPQIPIRNTACRCRWAWR